MAENEEARRISSGLIWRVGVGGRSMGELDGRSSCWVVKWPPVKIVWSFEPVRKNIKKMGKQRNQDRCPFSLCSIYLY